MLNVQRLLKIDTSMPKDRGFLPHAIIEWQTNTFLIDRNARKDAFKY